jgi:hypothetical protein
MQFPTPGDVEQSLKRFAEEIGDTTESPFRVDVVARYGGKPPLYTVMIRCAEKEPIRQKLSQVLNRSFSLGGTSFALNVVEAEQVVQYGKAEKPVSQPPTSNRS